jgi:GGDEF domain-containing protein
MDHEWDVLDEVYSKPENFLSRVNQELKRAQRYLSFVSYLNIDTQKLGLTDDTAVNMQNPDLLNRLRKHIRNAVRQTDLISGVTNGKLSVLLVETNREGAEIVKDRLRESIKYFLHEVVDSPMNWKVNIDSGSFPGDENTPNSFYDRINTALS